MNALATAPGVIATPGKYYIGAQEVMEYLDCKKNDSKICGRCKTESNGEERLLNRACGR